MDPNWVMRQGAMVAFDSVEYIEMSRTQGAIAGPRKVTSPMARRRAGEVGCFRAVIPPGLR